jgi:general secretion pathway protein D
MTHSTRHRRRARHAVLALAMAMSALMLAGCAQQRIRNQAQQSLSSGDYEKAIRSLETGLKEYPDSITLRSCLVQARVEAMTHLVTDAATLRAAGKLDEAKLVLMRGRELDPDNRRLVALLADLDTELRQQTALKEAESLTTANRPDEARRVIDAALKDNPRHTGLTTLQRRIEIQQRQAQSRAQQNALSETRTISLDFREASLRTVLDVVSRNSGINFILDREVRNDTRVTVFLRQARVEDALDLIIGTNQLAKKVIDAKTILVYPNTAEKQREYQEQIVRVFYLASAEAKGAASFLKSMLKIREPFVDERTNMLSLRDSQENIQLAERLIALYDASEPEVLLEVEVLEISSTRLTELGVKFPDSLSLVPLPPAGSTGLTLGNISPLGRDRVGLGIAGLLVNLKREVGDFTTLANPRIRARNKEKAKILIGDRIPIITTTTGTGGFVSDSINYLDVGLKLDVEPTVYANDEVAIKVSLEVSSLGSAVRTTSGTLAYQIGTRNASTLLRLRDGETQLLAGLISRDERTSSSRLPGVGDLPVLGRVFSSQLDNAVRSELVLAITPRVLRNIRQPDANETELWVGTDASPRLRLATAPIQDDAPAKPPRDGLEASPSSKAPEPHASRVARATPAAPTVLQWAGPAEASVDSSFELQLVLSSGAELRGMPLSIAYDKQHLQWQEAIEGDYFRKDGSATNFSQSREDQEGRVRLGILRNQATGISGKDTLLTLRFKALKPGATEVRIEQAQPIGVETGLPPTTSTQPWVVQVR